MAFICDATCALQVDTPPVVNPDRRSRGHARRHQVVVKTFASFRRLRPKGLKDLSALSEAM
jgi:hypothetical protein